MMRRERVKKNDNKNKSLSNDAGANVFIETRLGNDTWPVHRRYVIGVKSFERGNSEEKGKT